MPAPPDALHAGDRSREERRVSNLLNHREYWTRVLFAEEGPEYGQRAPTAKVFAFEEGHDEMETCRCGKYPDKDTFKLIWDHLESW